MRITHVVPALEVPGPSVPDRIGAYLIERPLDAGAMGTVYIARHALTRRQVALKVLHGVADEASTARFLREVRAASRIEHPGVVQTLDAGTTERGELYLVMELLHGETLGACIERGTPLPVLLHLLRLALEPLAAAHRAGIVHRDLKPENLFVVQTDEGPRVKLLDFGIAVDVQSGRSTQSIMGTPHYMSPEQACEPKRVGPASDVWSIGVMLYEILSGTMPFDGESAGAVVVAASTRLHVPLGERCPGAPAALVDAVEGCLRKAPEERFAHAGDLLQALAPLLEDVERWHTPPEASSERPRVAPSSPPARLAPPSQATWDERALSSLDDSATPPIATAGPRRTALAQTACYGALLMAMGLLLQPTQPRLATARLRSAPLTVPAMARSVPPVPVGETAIPSERPPSTDSVSASPRDAQRERAQREGRRARRAVTRRTRARTPQPHSTREDTGSAASGAAVRNATPARPRAPQEPPPPAPSDPPAPTEAPPAAADPEPRAQQAKPQPAGRKPTAPARPAHDKRPRPAEPTDEEKAPPFFSF